MRHGGLCDCCDEAVNVEYSRAGRQAKAMAMRAAMQAEMSFLQACLDLSAGKSSDESVDEQTPITLESFMVVLRSLDPSTCSVSKQKCFELTYDAGSYSSPMV